MLLIKKLICILFLGLLWSGVASAEEITLNCKFKNGHGIEGGKMLEINKGFKGTHDISISIETKTKSVNNFEGIPGFLAKNTNWSSNEITWKWVMDGNDQTVNYYRLNRLSGELNTSFNLRGLDIIKNYSCSKSERLF